MLQRVTVSQKLCKALHMARNQINRIRNQLYTKCTELNYKALVCPVSLRSLG